MWKRRQKDSIGSYWEEHKRTVERYWQEIRWVLRKEDGYERVSFQDGMPEGGKTAQIIIDKLAQTGSPNYQLLKNLVKKGAQMQKTEDPELLKQEYQLTKEFSSKRKSFYQPLLPFLNINLGKTDSLMREMSILLQQINQNLKEGETGMCFLGAYHDVVSKLSSDIKIVLVKGPDKVKKYYQRLTYGETQGQLTNSLVISPSRLKPE